MTTESVSEQEQRTFRQFLLVYGLVGWGLGMSLLMAWFFVPASLALAEPSLMLVAFVLCPLGGLLWAWLFWHVYGKHAVRRRRAAGATL